MSSPLPPLVSAPRNASLRNCNCFVFSFSPFSIIFVPFHFTFDLQLYASLLCLVSLMHFDAFSAFSFNTYWPSVRESSDNLTLPGGSVEAGICICFGSFCLHGLEETLVHLNRTFLSNADVCLHLCQQGGTEEGPPWSVTFLFSLFHVCFISLNYMLFV